MTVTSISRGILGEDTIAVCRHARVNLLTPIATGTQILTLHIEKEAAGTTMTLIELLESMPKANEEAMSQDYIEDRALWDGNPN